MARGRRGCCHDQHRSRFASRLHAPHGAKEPLIITDLHSEKRFGVAPLLREHGVVSGMSVIIGNPHNPFGVLGCHSTRLREFSQTDAQFLQSVGNLIAAAIERNQNEAALRASEQKYRSLLESIDEGFCIIEVIFDEKDNPVDYRWLEVNPAFERQTGLSDFREKTIREMLPAHETYWFEIYGRVARTGQATRFEHRAAQLGRWYDVYAWRHGDPRDGQVAVLFNDVTKRKLIEQSLAESARQQQALYRLADQLHRARSFADIYNAALDAILDALQCNRASILLIDDAVVMRFVGWRGLSDAYRRAVEGHSPWSVTEKNAVPIHIDDVARADLSDSLKSTIKGEGIGALVFVPVISDGKLIGKFMAYFNAPHVFTDEEIELSLTIARQLAFAIARKRADEELRESEGRFRAFFENSTLPLWEDDWSEVKAQLAEWSRSGITDLRHYLQEDPRAIGTCLSRVRLLKTNQAGVELLHAPDKDAVLKQLDRQIAPESWHVIADLLVAIATGQTHFRGESVLKGFTGETCHVIFDFVALPGHEETLEHVLVSLVDITEIKRAEETLREADRRKDEFLAMLAHELRNPLAPIRNATQALKLIGRSDAKQQRMLEVIERQIQYMARLVDDLLDVSRITRGKIALQRETLELATIVSRAVESSRPLIDARRHQLTVTWPPHSVRVDGDLTRLVQIIGNLLNNAAKYTDEGGHLWLEAADENGEAVIRVRDDGIGLSADMLPHVFDLFAQSNRSLDRSQGGLGIGLTLVRRLVEMHGGKVEARSEGPGLGSEFIVRLPEVGPKEASDVGKSRWERARIEAGALRVLIIEDNVDAAETLSFMLELGGHEVRIAHDGASGLAVADAFKPQVVVCDIGLPVMNGFEVAAKLHAQPGFEQTPLIALSGYGQEEDRRRSKEAGFAYHLTKPVEPEALMALLESLSLGASAVK
ncbi:MAG: response regulator [Polyangiaceae bacterium]|nr:response regulator [Polyangiaceae bacterium]